LALVGERSARSAVYGEIFAFFPLITAMIKLYLNSMQAIFALFW
jgi:hypothetical protein